MYYIIGREERENHPNQHKAVLYQTIGDGNLEKINVWKPNFESPKILRESMPPIPQKIWEQFEAEKEAIRKEEEESGVADW